MGEKVIELVHLQKQFGDHTVLRDIHLSVEKGEVLSIIGASGAVSNFSGCAFSSGI